MSFSNFKSAKVLSGDESGNPETLASFALSNQHSSEYVSIFPEVNFRYPLVPDVLELGHKLVYFGWLVLQTDVKYNIYSGNNMYISLDFDVQILYDTNQRVILGLSPGILYTAIFNSFSLTFAAKLIYYVNDSPDYFSYQWPPYLYYGGTFTFDIGKNWGFIPEVGIYLNTSV
jgi:hypothetical protein